MINLSKASRLVDDKRTLVADPTSQSSSKGRRKSAFAEEDEGYQYVEEGFRIRFANGETIDFYADSHAEKDLWMQAFSHVIGKPATENKVATWTDLVLSREKAEGMADLSASSPVKEAKGIEVKDFTKPPNPGPRSERRPAVASRAETTRKSVPASPVKGPSAQRAPQLPSQQQRPKTPPMAPRVGGRRRDAVKSMIF